jgi:hypothetical protein
MTISFQSDEEVLRKLRDRLSKMTDEELIRFGKEVRRPAENPFQRQLDEARAEWKRRKLQSKESSLCSLLRSGAEIISATASGRQIG